MAVQVVPESWSIRGWIPPAVWNEPTTVQAVPDRHEAASRIALVELAPVGSGASVAVGAPLVIDSIRPWATPLLSM